MTEQHNAKLPSSALDDGSCKASSRRRRPRRREDNPDSNFSFIHFTGEASFRPGRAQKAVRAQAARASSDRRLATIERRREASRANSADSSALLETASDGVYDNQLSPLSQNSLSPLTRARSAPPTLPREGLPSGLAAPGSLAIAEVWTCDLNGIVQHTLQHALHTMSRLQIPCDTSKLSRNFQDAALYRHPLMIQCLELLVTTSSDHQQRPAMSRAIIVLLRHKLIIAVQAIIQADVEAKKVLASVVALLAGWEAEHGEEHACEYHLPALAGLLPSSSQSQDPDSSMFHSANIPDLLSPTVTKHIPAGLRFYRSSNLLPASLVDSICHMGDIHHMTETSSQARRSALAALACRPKDSTNDRTCQQDRLVDRVCQHIQVAAAILALLYRAGDDVDQDQDCLGAWYAESSTLGTESLFGTIYDEVLIWTLCVFRSAVRQPAAEQVELLRAALGRNGIGDLDALGMLLARYVTPSSLLRRLRDTLGLV